MSIIVSKEARKDLVQIRQYISEELCNPDAAVRIMELLKKSIASLSDFPGRGRPLDALIPVHTDYRYLVCENYCVFYLSVSAAAESTVAADAAVPEITRCTLPG